MILYRNTVFFLLIFIFTSFDSWTQSVSYNFVSGSPFIEATTGYIPRYFRGDIATDLIFDGKALSAQEAFSLYRTGIVQDLSLLEPNTEGFSSVVGHVSNGSYSGSMNPGFVPGRELQSRTADGVNFKSIHGRENGSIRLSVSTADGFLLKLSFGPRAKNLVMTDTLIKKLGYSSVQNEYISNLRVRFESVLDKQRFLVDLNSNFDIFYTDDNIYKNFSEEKRTKLRTFLAGYENYMTDSIFEENDYIDFQGVVLSENSDLRYNLSDIQEDSEVKIRRKFSALLVPLCFTDLPESLNLFSYNVGSVINDRIYLDCIYANYRSANFEDTRWIVRKILQLDKASIDQITAGLEMEYCPKQLLNRILRARRDSLIELFNMESEFESWNTVTKINCGDKEVVNGVQQIAKYDGDPNVYAHSRFEGPLVFAEIFSFIKSIFFSNLLSYLTDKLNLEFPNSDLSEDIYRHRVEIAAKQFAEFIATGKVSKLNFDVYPIETYGMGLIYSRDIVAGNYLGTNNMVQLVDSFGFNLSYGKFLGTDGLAAKEYLTAMLGLGLQLSFTHIQPIQIEQPKIIGQESDVEGSLAKAFKKQRSKLLEVFSYPFSLVPKQETKKKPIELEFRESFVPELLIFHQYLLETKNSLLLDWNKIANKKSLEEIQGDGFKQEVRSFIGKLRASWKQATESCKENTCDSLASSFDEFYKESIKKINASLDSGQTGLKYRSINPEILMSFIAESLKKYPSAYSNFLAKSSDQRIVDFKENFPVGDSLIVNLGLDASARFNPGYVLSNNSSWFLDLNYEKSIVFRTHIQRVDENRIQIYRSIANKDLFEYLTGLQFYFRAISLGQSFSWNDVNTRMYTIVLKKLSSDSESPNESYANDPLIGEKLNAIRDLIFTGSLESIKKLSGQTSAKHNISHDKSKLNFLFIRKESYELYDKMDVENDEGDKVQVLRYGIGNRKGHDFQTLFTNWLNALLKNKTDLDLNVRIASNNDPGSTILGTSRSIDVSYEAILPEGDVRLDQSCIRIQKNWNQFLADKDSVQEEIEKLKKRYGFSLINLGDSDRILDFQLMSFVTSLNLFKPGIDHIVGLTNGDLDSILKENIIFPDLPLLAYSPRRGFNNPANSRRLNKRDSDRRIVSKFYTKLEKLKTAQSNMEFMEKLTDFLIHSEKYLSYPAFLQLVGGQPNVFIAWQIRAYRSGDESTKAELFQNTRGSMPSVNVCPVANIAQQTGYLESEFSLQWLYQRY